MRTTHSFLLANSFEPLPIADESIQLILTSPPYPMVEMWDDIFSTYNRGIKTSIKKGEGDKAFDKMHKLLDDCWTECYRLLAPGGFMAINIGNATRSLDGHFEMYSNHSRIMQACKKIGLDILPYIIWNKPTNSPTKFMGSGVLPAGAYITLEHEYILVFRKSGKRIFSDKEKEIRRQSAFYWEERNQWFSDQWHDIRGTRQRLKDAANRDRSGAYPAELAKRLLLMYSMYGDTVLDPFSGTGTTSYTAMTFGRNSIYVDIDKELRQSSLKELSASDQIEVMNQDVLLRLKNHEDYVSQQQNLFFKYRNDIINSPVKSNQEKLLQPFLIKDLISTKDKIKVSYKPFKGA